MATEIMARPPFSFVAQQPCELDDARHDELFGHLPQDKFTAAEAAEYLEVSLATFRRFVRDGRVSPSSEVGRNKLFSAAALKAFKRQRKAVKG
ncbi:helix-turn-helix domain-containing protein [Cupriavidus gilardii]|uniref:helix-turn-helix domain-containing protein n=1 Tax=Cupriavidus gilardii TaxID=82541 RepID=UPI0021BE0277|nr:helix-turn-helix domain-containing protein [Cupriavidus gilardii]MCT9126271.1 helix-turn-helix domain-containing protein [Cupriavidus gilardii]